MSTYCIGDVHGCWDTLGALLAELALGTDDRIHLAGDLVGGGPRPLEVLRWAREALNDEDRLESVLGNHDLYLVARKAGIAKAKRDDNFDELFDDPEASELIGWLRRRPLMVSEPSFVGVHAGLHPAWSVELALSLAREVEAALAGPGWGELIERYWAEAPDWSPSLGRLDRLASAMEVMVNVRCCDASGRPARRYKGSPGAAPSGLLPWFGGRVAGPVPIVFGHWAALGFHRVPGFVGIDSGCVWGGALSAFDPVTGSVVRHAAVEPAPRARE